MKHANRLIVGYLHSIAVRFSKMQNQTSLTLRWRAFWDMVIILLQTFLPSKAADGSIMDQ